MNIVIKKDAVSYDLTNYNGVNLVLKKSLEIHESEYGTEYAPTLNTASFAMRYAGVPAALLLENDVAITISDDGTPIFTGYVRPLSSIDLRRTGAAEKLTIEAEGCMSRLDAEHEGDTVDLGDHLVVCSPASPATSYVHILLARMGWTRGISSPEILRTMPIALVQSGDKLLDLIAKSLRCSGYYITECADGSLIVRQFVTADPQPAKIYSVAEHNIIGDLSITRTESDEKAIALTYGKYNSIAEYAILSEDVKHCIYASNLHLSCYKKPFVWPYNVSADGTPAHLYSDTEEKNWVWDDRYSVYQKKIDSAGEQTEENDFLIALPSPDVTGLVTGCWKYNNRRAEILLYDRCFKSSTWVGSVKKSGSIRIKLASDGTVTYTRVSAAGGEDGPLEADHPLYGCVKIASWTVTGLNLAIGPIPYKNDDPHLIYLEGYVIYGTLDYIHANPEAKADDDGPRIVQGVGTKKKISCEFCLQPADAEGISKAFLIDLNSPRISFCTADPVPCGTCINLLREGRGIDIVGRVVERTRRHENISKPYELTVCGLRPLTIDTDYMPSIRARRATSQSYAQTVADLIAARIRQAHAEAGIDDLYEQVMDEDDRLIAVEIGFQKVHAGDIAEGAIQRASLEAGFVDEHDNLLNEVYPEGTSSSSSIVAEREDRLAEVAAERDRLDLLEPEIFPQGPDAPSTPDIIAGDLLSVGALADALEREIASRDEGLVMAEQRILLIAQDTAGAVERVASLELTVSEIEAIVSEFEGDHARVAALELRAGGIEASVSDYDAEKAKIATLELTVESINSILAELNVGGEIINLSLIVQNADRISQIVATGGYTDEQNVFHPTKAYSQVTQLADRYELFLAGDASEKDLAAWIATSEQIASFVTAAQVTGEITESVAPVEASVSAIEQRADALELSVADVAGTIDRTALETRETLFAALDELEAQASAGIVITQNRINLVVAAQQDEDTSIWARIGLEADRITSEVGRASGSEVDLSSRITQEAGRISQEIEDRTQGIVDARSYVDQTATSLLSSVESGMQALEGTLRQVASAEAAAAQTAASAYADGIVTEEEQRAIADAQAKADAARAAAIAAAAADAAAKADVAQQAATQAAATYTDAQILQLDDEITARVQQTEIALDPQADGSIAYKAVAAWAQILLEPGTMATRVAETENGVIENSSAIQQTKEMIAAIVDDALNNVEAGLVVTGNRIEIAVSQQVEVNTQLLARLAIEAERITSEVDRATAGEENLYSRIEQESGRITSEVARAVGAEAVAASRITQNEQAIIAEVARAGAADETMQSSITLLSDRISAEVTDRQGADSELDAQLVLQAASIAARVQARTFDAATGLWSDVQAFMALSVTLPEVLSLERHDAIRSLLSADDRPIFDLVYEQYQAPWSEDGGQTWESDVRYRISPATTSDDLALLRTAMAAVGAVSSQFAVDADEVLIPGTIRGRHLEMESISTEIFQAIKARIQALSAKSLLVDTDLASSTDFEVEINDGVGIVVRKAGNIIFSVNPLTGRCYLCGDIDVDDGIFRGSIESGPLTLNKNAPSSAAYTIGGSVVAFILNLAQSAGLSSGRFACSGSYGSSDIGAVQFVLTQTTKTYTYEQWVSNGYKDWHTVYTWSRSLVRSDVRIQLYSKSSGELLCDYVDYLEPSATWVRGAGREGHTTPLRKDPDPSPNPSAVLGGTVAFGEAGSLSLSAGAFTYRLNNLPAGYSDSYLAGTVYVDASGFLKVRP